MFNNRSFNKKINLLHERALRITYDDKSSSFEELLRKDSSVSTHHRNIQVLETEVFKSKNDIVPVSKKVLIIFVITIRFREKIKLCLAWY